MNKSKYLTFLFTLSLCFSIHESIGQVSSPNNCSQLTFETKVIHTVRGKNIGDIEFLHSADDKSRFKIFLLNKGTDTAKSEITSRRLKNLSAGTYEFIIIDTKEKKCFKEVSILIQELN